MKVLKIAGIGLIALLLLPLIIGFTLPKSRLITEKTLIDNMYFMVLADVTNHWEEPLWNTAVDTLIQTDAVDGLDAWKEFYAAGDSALFLVQRTSDKDYIRLYIDKDGTERNYVITLVEAEEKTAVRISKEVSVKNPYQRFFYLFSDKEREKVKQYLKDLKARSVATAQESDSGDGW